MEGGDAADSAVSALFAMQGSKEVVNMNVSMDDYVGYGAKGGIAMNAELEEDDDDDDDCNNQQFYYTIYTLPSPSSVRPKNGGGGGGGANSTPIGNDPDERLQRSRERNRMHARKTRQRKKLQMQTLQVRAEELKLEQLRLKQIINDRKMANILLEITSTSSPTSNPAAAAAPQLPATFHPDIEQILRRPNDEIPDGKKIMKETTAMVPSHKAKLIRSMSLEGGDVTDALSGHQKNLTMNGKFPDDGIDYALLSKDRNKCTPQELDKIRKERNRMHAKRTRDRKKIFVQEMLNVIQVLDAENLKLRALIQQYYPENTFSMSTHPAPDPSQLPPPPITTYYAGTSGKSRKTAANSSTAMSSVTSTSTPSYMTKTRRVADSRKTRPSYSHHHSTRSSSSALASASSSTSGKTATEDPGLSDISVKSTSRRGGIKRGKGQSGAFEACKRAKGMGDAEGIYYYSNSSDGGTSSDGHTDAGSNTTSSNNTTNNKSSTSSSLASNNSNSDGETTGLADDVSQ
eukprot:CAMPEP_0118638720 /NCGR_PEP_ID=MMETSP0785-20121206/3846_1 /TAXON_ID=91992 /ORGANISM="Bolidomonas pacifica, Strain CCMP 1866" /LENGTH=515 /DNA_ID=CAMNT_0006530011 /DNA_START=57 /DNA_END=1604 /DNA_ORIENTATION=-